MPKRRFQALVLTFFLAACIGVPLEAEPVVVIESPILESDMAGLQEILDQSIADFAAEIDELTGETLEKPDFLRGSSYATSQAILSSLSIHDVTRPFIAIGSSAAYYSPWLSTAVVSELDSLDVTSDVDAGACVQPLVLRGGLRSTFAGRTIRHGNRWLHGRDHRSVRRYLDNRIPLGPVRRVPAEIAPLPGTASPFPSAADSQPSPVRDHRADEITQTIPMIPTVPVRSRPLKRASPWNRRSRLH